MKLRQASVLFFLSAYFMLSCQATHKRSTNQYQSLSLNDEIVPNQIQIQMSPEDYQSIMLSSHRDVQASKIINAGSPTYKKSDTVKFGEASIIINNKKFELEKLSLRGQGCLSADRKCFSVKVAKCQVFKNDSGKKCVPGKKNPKISFQGHHPVHKVREFNLTSMVSDLGYVSNKIAFELMNRTNLSDLRMNYAFLTIKEGPRQHHAGIYLVTEKPANVLKKRHDAKFVLRRTVGIRGYVRILTGTGWNHMYKVNHVDGDEESYRNEYESLIDDIDDLSDQELNNSLSERIDLESLQKWMIFNRLVKNVDYEDEVYLYKTKPKSKYRVYPWDYDDIFQEGNNRGVGAAMVLKRDPLQSRIEKSPIFMQNLNAKALEFLPIFTDQLIDEAIDRVRTEIEVYLNNREALSASVSDKIIQDRNKSYSKEEILELLEKRKSELKQTRDEILNGKVIEYNPQETINDNGLHSHGDN